jgi:hypothetical protein
VSIELAPFSMPAKDDMPRTAIGSVLMVLGIAMLVYDSTQEWDTIWATAAGIKFIMVGVIFLIWGPLKRLDERRSEPGSDGPR